MILPELEMAESARRSGQTRSWRGSREDFRADVECAMRLVAAQAAPSEATDLSLQVELEDRSRSYANIERLAKDLPQLDLSKTSEIGASMSNKAVSLMVRFKPSKGAGFEIIGKPADVEGIRIELLRQLEQRESTPAWLRSGLLSNVQFFAMLFLFFGFQLWIAEEWSFISDLLIAASALIAVLFALRVILRLVYPVMEITVEGRSRSAGVGKGLRALAGYAVAAVIGALVSRLIG